MRVWPALDLAEVDAHDDDDEEVFFSRVASTDEEPDDNQLFFSRVPSTLGEHEVETLALNEDDDDFEIVDLDDEHNTGHNWQSGRPTTTSGGTRPSVWGARCALRAASEIGRAFV